MTALPEVGESRSAVVCEEITRTRIFQYAASSGDFSVLHTDEPAAQAAGYPSIMAHGMMTMAMSCRVVTDWFGREALTALTSRFTAVVFPGDRLTTVATVCDLVRDDADDRMLAVLTISTTNQDGVVVLEGTASVDVTAGRAVGPRPDAVHHG